MKQNVLIVDNDFFFAEFISDLLIAKGYRTLKAYDGKQGIQAIDEHDIHLMFVDMLIPKIDGWRLIRYVRTRFPSRPFPIVALSGIVIEQLDDIKTIGADYYMTKGPLSRMKPLLHDVLDRIASEPVADANAPRVFENKDLYPRREAVALLESLRFQRAVTECMGVGMLVADRDARVLIANPQALEMLKRSEVAVLNRPLPEIFAREEQLILHRGMKKIATDRSGRRKSFRFFSEDSGFLYAVTRLVIERQHKGWIMAMADPRRQDILFAQATEGFSFTLPE